MAVQNLHGLAANPESRSGERGVAEDGAPVGSLPVESRLEASSAPASASPVETVARRGPVLSTAAIRSGVAQGGGRTWRSAGALEGAAGLHAAPAQRAVAADASTLERNPLAMHLAEPVAQGALETREAAVSSAAQAFAALDAEAGAVRPGWVHAGAQRAEAGFQDPALGWIGVRAELGAGGIHAAILPGNAEAAQALGGHLAGLQTHLAASEIPVHALSMTATAEVPVQGSGHGAKQQGNSGDRAEQRSGMQRRLDGQGSRQGISRLEDSASNLAGNFPPVYFSRAGHISVVA